MIGVRAVEARGLVRREPVFDEPLKHFRTHPRMGHRKDFSTLR